MSLKKTRSGTEFKLGRSNGQAGIVELGCGRETKERVREGGGGGGRYTDREIESHRAR